MIHIEKWAESRPPATHGLPLTVHDVIKRDEGS